MLVVLGMMLNSLVSGDAEAQEGVKDGEFRNVYCETLFVTDGYKTRGVFGLSVDGNTILQIHGDDGKTVVVSLGENPEENGEMMLLLKSKSNTDKREVGMSIDENNFYRERFDLHKSYVNFMSDEYPHYRKSVGIGDLTSGLNKLNDRGLIQFSTPRAEKEKHGDSMSYRFGSLNELKELFVDKIFDGDQMMAWGEEDFPEDETDTTTPSDQKEMFDMFKKSNDLLKQKLGKSETEDWEIEDKLDQGLEKMSDEFTEDLFFEEDI